MIGTRIGQAARRRRLPSTPDPPAWRWTDWGSLATALAGAALVFYMIAMAWLHLIPKGPYAVVADSINTMILVVATAQAVRAGCHTPLDSHIRRAWSFLAVAFACQTVYFLGMVWSEIRENQTTGLFGLDIDIQYFALAAFVVQVIGLLSFPAARYSRADRLKLRLDILITMVAAIMAHWFLLLGPRLGETWNGPLEMFTTFAWPAGDLLTMFAVITVLMRGVAPISHRPVRLLAAGFTLAVLNDVYYIYVFDRLTLGSWGDFELTVGLFLLALAANDQYRTAGRRRQQQAVWTPRPTRTRDRLPYVVVALAFVLLMVAARGVDLYPLGGMVIGMILLTLVVMARQLTAAAENRRLATTDPLTGIANRALLTERLEHAVMRSNTTGRPSGVLLIDLDHFKPINDTYGHEAGDAVLIAVANALRSATRASDHVGRLGGDEFAVVLTDLGNPAPTTIAAEIGERILAQLRTPVSYDGRQLTVTASIGAAITDAGTTTADELLRRADIAMYTAKRTDRDSIALIPPEPDPAPTA